MTDTAPRPSPAAFQRHRQGMAALALRLAGASYSEVAEALAMPDLNAARAAIEAELGNMVDDHDKVVLRAEEEARLGRLLRAFWPKATDTDSPEQLQAGKMCLDIIRARTKLLGLDAPTEVAVYTPTTTEIDQWVHSLTAGQAEDLMALEADVIDVPALEAGDD